MALWPGNCAHCRVFRGIWRIGSSCPKPPVFVLKNVRTTSQAPNVPIDLFDFFWMCVCVCVFQRFAPSGGESRREAEGKQQKTTNKLKYKKNLYQKSFFVFLLSSLSLPFFTFFLLSFFLSIFDCFPLSFRLLLQSRRSRRRARRTKQRKKKKKKKKKKKRRRRQHREKKQKKKKKKKKKKMMMMMMMTRRKQEKK